MARRNGEIGRVQKVTAAVPSLCRLAEADNNDRDIRSPNIGPPAGGLPPARQSLSALPNLSYK